MADRGISLKDALPTGIIAWILSLRTLLIIVYSAPTILVGDQSVADLKLAPHAIPYASTFISDFNTTTETTRFVDMSGMSVNISLNRKSHLLVLFNVEAYASGNEWITIHALVGADTANPGEIYLTPNIYGSVNESYLVD